MAKAPTLKRCPKCGARGKERSTCISRVKVIGDEKGETHTCGASLLYRQPQ